MKSLDTTNSEDDLAVYVMTHGPECTWLADYCIPLEIGAACRENHCCELRDDMGDDNISEKDRLYCELTGLYWMWKNDNHKYVGLYHYRRVFNLTTSKIRKYLSKYDYILPRRVFIKPNIADQYCAAHIHADWEVANTVLKELYPDYYDSSQKIFNGQKAYFMNMFITSNEQFCRYCNWLFPLLFEIEKRIDLNDGRSAYNMRTIGFLAERLFSLYILHNGFNVKEVKVWFVPPYVSISSKCPKPLSKILMSNFYLYNITLTAQNKIYYLLQKIRS